MVGRVVNEFRKENGRCQLGMNHWQQNMFCMNHSLAMAERGEVYHADLWLLNGWCEAVAMCSCVGDWGAVERELIFDVLGSDEEHRKILLDTKELAYGITFKNDRVYLTVRGRY